MAAQRLALILAALSIAMVAPAIAQQSPMPPEISAKLQEIGRVIDPPKTAELYAPLQAKEMYPRLKLETDVKYGPDDRNLLDVFAPDGAAPPRPVLIFVHGGGFVAGNKHAPGSPFYDNIMLWAVKNGFVGVNMEYPSPRNRRGPRARGTSPLSCNGFPKTSPAAAATPQRST
jgi:acetyl esterase/lipase